MYASNGGVRTVMMRLVVRGIAAMVVLVGTAVGAADALPSLTVDERIRLVKEMQQCWKNESVRLADTHWKGGGSLKADVEGALRKVASVAGDAKVSSDFRRLVRSEFAAFSDSNAALAIRGCYKALFGEELTSPAPSLIHSKSKSAGPVAPRRTSKEAPPKAAPEAIQADDSAYVEQTIDAAASRVKVGDMKAVTSGKSVKQVIKGRDGASIEVGDISSGP